MLTHHDRTVDDGLAVLDEILPLGVRHIGFKDIGVNIDTLDRLNKTIKTAGATSYLEVVSTGAEASLASMRSAVQIGVDRLLGGTLMNEALSMLGESALAYFPFPGTPRGHPTRLFGGADDIREDCRKFMAAGCAGADLLAYRAEEAEPLTLVRAAREGLGEGHLIVAGSVNSPERIHALAMAGADAFTMGSAIFERAFSPNKKGLRDQVADVLAACG